MKKLVLLFTVIALASCSKSEEFIDYSAQNDAEIQAYIASNNLNAIKSNTGLYYVINEQGTGEKPMLTDRVKVAYKGYFTDGTVFDENTEGYSTYLQNVIQGWAEGITYLNEGGSGILLIPAHLAYGSNSTSKIPAGSVLVFEIELIYVNYKTENDQDIQAYIETNNLNAQKSSTGLYYVIDTPGTGKQPIATDNVTVAYKGYFLKGTVFDQSSASGVSFNLKNVIKGWTEGITYYKEGGTGKLLIPAHLGYGNYNYSTIPAGSVLIFDVELKSVN